MDGLGIGLIAPYISALQNPNVIANHWVFIKINKYIGINSDEKFIFSLSILFILFYFNVADGGRMSRA